MNRATIELTAPDISGGKWPPVDDFRARFPRGGGCGIRPGILAMSDGFHLFHGIIQTYDRLW